MSNFVDVILDVFSKSSNSPNHSESPHRPRTPISNVLRDFKPVSTPEKERKNYKPNASSQNKSTNSSQISPNSSFSMDSYNKSNRDALFSIIDSLEFEKNSRIRAESIQILYNNLSNWYDLLDINIVLRMESIIASHLEGYSKQEGNIRNFLKISLNFLLFFIKILYIFF